MNDPTTSAPELQRTMFIAALWFTAALLSGTITTAMLLAAGWRPYLLDPLPRTIWLASGAVAVVGTVLLAWAGCPVTKRGVESENTRKSITVRIGIVAFMAGIGVASLVELFTPPVGG